MRLTLGHISLWPEIVHMHCIHVYAMSDSNCLLKNEQQLSGYRGYWDLFHLQLYSICM